MLVLEDLQWMDNASWTLLNSLVWYRNQQMIADWGMEEEAEEEKEKVKEKVKGKIKEGDTKQKKGKEWRSRHLEEKDNNQPRKKSSILGDIDPDPTYLPTKIQSQRQLSTNLDSVLEDEQNVRSTTSTGLTPKINKVGSKKSIAASPMHQNRFSSWQQVGQSLTSSQLGVPNENSQYIKPTQMEMSKNIRNQLLSSLSNVPALAKIPQETMKELVNDSEVVMYQFSHGHDIVEQGKRSYRALMVVNRGCVNLVRSRHLDGGCSISIIEEEDDIEFSPQLVRKVQANTTSFVQPAFFAEETLHIGCLYSYSAVAWNPSDNGNVEVIVLHHKTLAKYVSRKNLERIETMLVDLQMGRFRSMQDLLRDTTIINEDDSEKKAGTVDDDEKTKISYQSIQMARLMKYVKEIEIATKSCTNISLLITLFTRKMINPPQNYNAIKSLKVEIEMRLQPLTKKNTSKHIQSMITSLHTYGTVQAVTENVVDFIYTKSDGNPLFTESLVKSLLAAKMLLIINGTCQLSKNADVKDTPIPQTMEDAIMSQVQALTPEEQEVLKVASVAGVNFDLQLIMYLCAQEIRKLNPTEEQLQHQEKRNNIPNHLASGTPSLQLLIPKLKRRERDGQIVDEGDEEDISNVISDTTTSKLMSRFMAGGVHSMISSQKNVTRIVTNLVRIHNILRYDTSMSCYKFKRPVVRDTIYNTINIPLRRELHMKVGDLLLSSASQSRKASNWSIGLHYMKAGQTTMIQRKAAYFISMAADEAIEHADISFAITLLKHLLSCLEASDVGITHSNSFAGALLHQDSHHGVTNTSNTGSQKHSSVISRKTSHFTATKGEYHNMNLSSITLRSYTLRRLADAYWQISDLENARYYLSLAALLHVADPHSWSSIKRSPIKSTFSNQPASSSSILSLANSGNYAATNQQTRKNQSNNDRKSKNLGSSAGIDATQAGDEFAKIMKSTFAKPHWKNIQLAMSMMVKVAKGSQKTQVNDLQGASTAAAAEAKVHLSHQSHQIKESVIRHAMEERELLETSLLAAKLGVVNGWDVLGIYQKCDYRFLIDIYTMLQRDKRQNKSGKEYDTQNTKEEEDEEDEEKKAGEEQEVMEEDIVVGPADIEIDLLQIMIKLLQRRKRLKKIISFSIVKHFFRCGKSNKTNTSNTSNTSNIEGEDAKVPLITMEEKDDREIHHLLELLRIKLQHVSDHLKTHRLLQKETTTHHLHLNDDSTSIELFYQQKSMTYYISTIFEIGRGLAWDRVRLYGTTAAEAYAEYNREKMYIYSLRLVALGYLFQGKLKRARDILHNLSLNMSSTTSIRVQLMLLVDQLYIQYRSGEWKDATKLQTIVIECHHLAKAVELYRYGSLTSAEVCYIYGVLSYITFYGCNDILLSQKFGKTAMLHTKNLRGKEPWHHKDSDHSNTQNETKKDPHRNNNSSVRRGGVEKSSSSFDKVGADSVRSSDTPTPLSSALLYALIGTDLLLDVFVTAHALSVHSYDHEETIQMYRKTCLDIIQMQKHLAKTIPIAQGYVEYSKIRALRASNQWKSTKKIKQQILHAKQVVKQYRLHTLEISIDLEVHLLHYMSEQKKLFQRSTVHKIAQEDASMSLKFRKDSETRHAMQGIITRFEQVGDWSHTKRTKKILKEILGMSKTGFGQRSSMHDQQTWST